MTLPSSHQTLVDRQNGPFFARRYGASIGADGIDADLHNIGPHTDQMLAASSIVRLPDTCPTDVRHLYDRYPTALFDYLRPVSATIIASHNPLP